MQRLLILAALLGAAAPVPLLAAATGPCGALLPDKAAPDGANGITAESLIELRDIGYPAPIAKGLTLGLSPDGRKLAFPIQRADLTSNSYCSAVIVLDLATHGASVVGSSDALAMADAPYRGPMVPNAAPAFVKPRWSPDGQWLAFLRSDRGITSLWRARVDGSHLSQVPGTDATIDSFAWSRDGSRLIISSRPKIAEETRDLQHEALVGFRYDERFLPFTGATPFPLISPLEIHSINLATGMLGAPSDDDAKVLHEATDPSRTPAPTRSAREAWTAPEHADRIGSPAMLHVADDGNEIACPRHLCASVSGFWWADDGSNLAFLRREGEAGEQTALYVWTVGRAVPRRIILTEDLLIGCIRSKEQLICARETATEPRRIVSIDLETGRSNILFDPNPSYPSGYARPAERLVWRTDKGTPVFGDLVLPKGYVIGRRYPLIITNYQTRGFLRGATGDEFPIQLFAARGFAVLSLDRPRDLGTDTPGIRNIHELQQFEGKDWADRANVESAVERGVQQLVSRRIVDPDKIGITGLSDGSETVTYAILHFPHLAAASMSNCCNEPEAFLAMGGPATADDFRSLGYPDLMDHDAVFWEPASLAYNAHSIKVPILMQLPDQEFWLSLQSIEALREAKAPVDAYIFPGEGHIKLSPQHRMAVYKRNLAWFDFWLRGVRDDDLVPGDVYGRWEKLRSDAGGTATASLPLQ
jgi:dienelactone hydrolase